MKLESKNNEIREQNSKLLYSINPKRKYIEPDKLDHIEKRKAPNTKIY